MEKPRLQWYRTQTLSRHERGSFYRRCRLQFNSWELWGSYLFLSASRFSLIKQKNDLICRIAMSIRNHVLMPCHSTDTQYVAVLLMKEIRIFLSKIQRIIELKIIKILESSLSLLPTWSNTDITRPRYFFPLVPLKWEIGCKFSFIAFIRQRKC